MSNRSGKFIALANKKKRVDLANALERSRQRTEVAEDETQEKRDERERLDRRLRARERVERLKQVLAEHPEVKVACYLMSMSVAFLAIQFLLEHGKQEW